MNKFFIIANKIKDPELEKTKAISQFLELRGKKCAYAGIDRVYENDDELAKIAAKIKEDTDVIVSLGGDGTLIQIADIAAVKGIPILGVNMGNLGYLCEVEKDKVFDALERLIYDDYEVEKRMMIAGEMTVASVKMAKVHALNDIVIARRGTLGTLGFRVSVNDIVLYTCSSDGMIISTPTGSTGYNISAGGPIVAPYSEGIILTPICAHSLNIRPIVLSKDDTVEIEVLECTRKSGINLEVSFDGDKACPMNQGDRIVIKKSFSEAKIIKLSKSSFFEALSGKMSER